MAITLRTHKHEYLLEQKSPSAFIHTVCSIVLIFIWIKSSNLIITVNLGVK